MYDKEVEHRLEYALRQRDSSLNHVQGHLFYNKTVSWELLERTPEKNIPDFGIIFNLNTKEAFLAGELGLRLIGEQRIEWVTSDYIDSQRAIEEVNNLVANLGLKMNWRTVEMSDLKSMEAR